MHLTIHASSFFRNHSSILFSIFRIGLLFMFLFSSTPASAQKEGNNWIFGLSCPLCDSIEYGFFLMHFEGDTFSMGRKWLTPNTMDFTNTTLSDSSGNLLWYSEGVNIYNQNDEIIPEGDTFPEKYSNYFPCAHCALLLPLGDQRDKATFLFSDFFKWFNPIALPGGGWFGGNHILSSSTIERDSITQTSVVTNREEVLLVDTFSARLSAVRHGNGRDWWVLANKDSTNLFYRFLVDPSGAHLYGEQNEGTLVSSSLGQSNYSPNGKWYAIYNTIGTPRWSCWLDLYRFDRCTGLLSDHLQIELDSSIYPGGLAFSPNSRFLYVSIWDDIYQYDLEALDIKASATLVATYDGFKEVWLNLELPTRFFTMALAPDNKIYISTPNYATRYLHVIANPDALGQACNVLQHHVPLPYFNSFSIPNNPNYKLKDWEGSPCDSLYTPIAVRTPQAVAQTLRSWPNPAHDLLYIGLPQCDACSGGALEIYSVEGRKMRSIQVNTSDLTISLSVKDLQEGFYVCTWSKEGSILAETRFLVQH
jgi:Secretion system C-terminal sorting domain